MTKKRELYDTHAGLAKILMDRFVDKNLLKFVENGKPFVIYRKSDDVKVMMCSVKWVSFYLVFHEVFSYLAN